MKARMAVITLLAIVFTFVMTWGLYPLKAEAVGILFVSAFVISVLLVTTLEWCYKFLEGKGDKNEKTTEVPPF